MISLRSTAEHVEIARVRVIVGRRRVAGLGVFRPRVSQPREALVGPRDRAIGLFVALIQRLPLARRRFDDLVGGQALQTCLRRGWVSYQIAIFRRACSQRCRAFGYRPSRAASSPVRR